MSARFLTALLTAALTVAGFLTPVRAQLAERLDVYPVEEAKLVTRIHPVLDLVVPLEPVHPPCVVNLPKTPVPAAPQASAPAVTTTKVPHPVCALPEKGTAAGPCCALVKEGTAAGSSCALVKECAASGPSTKPTFACAQPVAELHLSPVTQEATLIKLIISTVAPQSWASAGGRGTIDYFPLGATLVVNQTPDIQEQVAELLQSLRRLQDQQVAVEVRFISVSESFFERIGVDFNVNINTGNNQTKYEPQIVSQQFQPFGFINQFTPSNFVAGLTPAKVSLPKTPGVTLLNDCQVRALLEDIQGDQGTHVMQAPKLTLFNGQASTLDVTDRQFFVTSVEVTKVNNQNVYVPQNKHYTTGLQMSVQPVISADRRFVRLNLKATETTLDTPAVPLFPVTTFITPIFEGGAVGQPVPFTQFIQQPKFSTHTVDKTVSIPDGGTVLLDGWKKVNHVRYEYGPPVLSKLPFVNRLFKNVGYRQETEYVMLMVTPRIIVVHEEEEVRPVAAICPAPKVKGGQLVDANTVAKIVADEIAKWEQAQAKYRKAEHYRLKGKTELASRTYTEVQRLCPNSRYAQLAARRLDQLDARLVTGSHQGNAAEQEMPPWTAEPTPRPLVVLVTGQGGEVAAVVQAYHKACAEGRLTEAKKLAGQALALDPTCFSKGGTSKSESKGEPGTIR